MQCSRRGILLWLTIAACTILWSERSAAACRHARLSADAMLREAREQASRIAVSEAAAQLEEGAAQSAANDATIGSKIIPVPCDGPVPGEKASQTIEFGLVEPARAMDHSGAAPQTPAQQRLHAMVSSDVAVPPPRVHTVG